ncbi:MAG: PrpF domain-containing protein, partial [Dehalococcoidia bacterium]
TGAKILMWFENPEGSVTGRLLPTGNPQDELEVPGLGRLTVSILDASNPLVFVKASRLGLRGTEPPKELDASRTFLQQIEAIRSVAAQRIGLVESWQDATRLSPAVPKAALVAPPQTYRDLYGNPISAKEVNLVARMMSMQKTHQAYPLTGAICTAVAACFPGTLVHEVCRGVEDGGTIRIGHASGIISLQTELETKEGSFQVRRVGVTRTARRIMEGFVYVNL